MSLRGALVSLLAMLLLAGASACGSEGAPRIEAAPSTAYFATEEGSLARWTGEAGSVATLDGVLPSSTAREIAFDAASGLLWYSDNHSHLASIDPVTLEAGPSIGGFGDVAMVGCSVSGRPRTLAVDAARRLLLVPQLTGGVLEYRLDDLTLEGVIPTEVFGEPALGAFRRLALAPDGHLWFVSADGSIVEVDRESGPTGQRVTPEARVVAIAGDGSGPPVVRTDDGVLSRLDAGHLTVVWAAPSDVGPAARRAE